MQIRPTVAEIDLNALRHNLRLLKTQLSAGVEWIPMVKADAYGHGVVPVSEVLRAEGVGALGVSLVEEALELRSAGDRGRLLTFGTFSDHGELIIQNQITPVLSTFEQIEALRPHLRSAHPVQVKINTGMNRLGFSAHELPELQKRLQDLPQLQVEAVMTHLHSGEDADLSEGATERQFREFARLAMPLLPDPRRWHIWSTSALLKAKSLRERFRASGFGEEEQMGARPGLAIYGASPTAQTELSLQPVMSLRSRIVKINRLQAGETAGYGATFRALRSTRLAVIPLGYADGYHRALSNRGQVLIDAQRAPVVGRVSMDFILVDVTDLPGAQIDSEVLIFGKDRLGNRLEVHELANWAGTAAWEMLTSVSKRVPRKFRGGAA